MKKHKTLIKIAYLGMFLAFAMIIAFVETLLPFFPYAPGVKLGLANCFIVLVLYLYGPGEAAIVNISRVILCSLLFSGLYALMYSMAGAVLSLLVMTLFYRRRKTFSPIGIGMLGGMFHNIGQIAVAFFVTHTVGLLGYLPVLIASGLITGALVGLFAKLMLPRMEHFLRIDGGSEKEK